MKPTPRVPKLSEFLAILVFALIVLGAAACSKEQASEAQLGVIEAQSLIFNGVPVGSSRVFTATVTNSGTEDAVGINVRELSAPFSLEGSTCGLALASKVSCQLKFAFVPTSVGSFEEKVSVFYFSGDKESQVSLTLTASSVMPATLSMSGVSDYLSVVIGNDATQVLTVTNNGHYSAQAISFLGIEEPYHLESDTCDSISLAPGASCTVKIRFQPTDTIPANKTFYLSYLSGAAIPVVSYGLTGIGKARAVLNITGNLDFGDRKTSESETRNYLLTNGGQSEATNIAMPTLPTDGFSLGVTDCTDHLASGASCQFEITFAPSVIAPASSSIEFTYEDGLNTGVSASAVFVGNGIAP